MPSVDAMSVTKCASRPVSSTVISVTGSSFASKGMDVCESSSGSKGVDVCELSGGSKGTDVSGCSSGSECADDCSSSSSSSSPDGYGCDIAAKSGTERMSIACSSSEVFFSMTRGSW